MSTPSKKIRVLVVDDSTLRMKVESSTTSTRIFFEGVDMVQLRHRRGARRLRSDELFDGRKQFIFLYRLGQEGGSAILYGAVAMLGAGARGYHHHRNAAGGRTLAQLHQDRKSTRLNSSHDQISYAVFC